MEMQPPLSPRARDGVEWEDASDEWPPLSSTEPDGLLSAPGTTQGEGGAGITQREAAAVLDQALSEGRHTQTFTAPPQPGRTASVLLQALSEARRTTQAALSHTAGTTLPTLPALADTSPSLTLLDWDRAMQRDARRYDGGFTLY